MLMEMNLFFAFSIETSKCSGSCNNINYPYAKVCAPDLVKNLNVKVINLMSRTNETRHIEWQETCKYECKFGANICNNKPIKSEKSDILTLKIKLIVFTTA